MQNESFFIFFVDGNQNPRSKFIKVFLIMNKRHNKIGLTVFSIKQSKIEGTVSLLKLFRWKTKVQTFSILESTYLEKLKITFQDSSHSYFLVEFYRTLSAELNFSISKILSLNRNITSTPLYLFYKIS